MNNANNSINKLFINKLRVSSFELSVVQMKNF